MKQWFAKKTFSALDFGADLVRVLVLEQNGRGGIKVLASAEAPSKGFAQGELSHVGDAVEAIVDALREARSSAGCDGGTLYYNLDDPKMESLFPRGSKNLSGEGQIRPQDVAQVKDAAERLISRFEKVQLYAAELKFLIDGKDAVLNPLGTFGRSLDVFMHVVMIRSDHADLWSKVMKRAGVRKGVPVLSAWSTAKGVIPASETNKRRLLFDLGRDLTSVFVHTNDRITDHRSMVSCKTEKEFLENAAAAARDLFSRHANIEEALATGDRAGDAGILERLGQLTSFPVQPAPLPSLSGCERPWKSSLAGLAAIGGEMEKQKGAPALERDFLVRLKEKAVSFFEAYF